MQNKFMDSRVYLLEQLIPQFLCWGKKEYLTGQMVTVFLLHQIRELILDGTNYFLSLFEGTMLNHLL
jgi:hypothetical protein